MTQILLDSDGKAILKNGAAISVSGSSPTPSIPTTLGSRIDNKATVVGVLQDHEGNDYVLAVVDAAYRSGEGMYWSTEYINTLVPNRSSDNFYTGKYNTDIIVENYQLEKYPAFNFARYACTITLNGNTYYSVLPSLNELRMLYNNKDSLDQYDPTVSQYSDRSMSAFNFNGNGAWSSTEGTVTQRAVRIDSSGIIDNSRKYGGSGNNFGVCPVIIIPLT